ncbi:MAG: hypothetical protein QM730_25720 [Anaerolineales bacterium]
MVDLQEQIQKEFEKADQARSKGNEGQARVCARRAAGIAIREYLNRKGIRPKSPSAVDLLKSAQRRSASFSGPEVDR